MGEIIVVSGLPRSGTSLMMQMLDAAGIPILQDELRGADDSNPRGYYELEAVKASRRDVGWVDRATGHAVKVIHALLPYLPRERRYRVILMERPVGQVVRSQNRMLEASGDVGDGISSRRLGEILDTQLEQSRRLLENEACFEWMAVSYPQLIAEPRQQAARIIDFLDLNCSGDSLSSVVTPELFRNRD